MNHEEIVGPAAGRDDEPGLPDTSLIMSLGMLDFTLEELYLDAMNLVEQGVMTEPMELYLNDNDYMMYATVDGSITMVYLPLSDEVMLSIVFSANTPEVYAESTLLFEIPGTVASAE